jgi:hypothetical protein
MNEIDVKIQNLENILFERKELPIERKNDLQTMINFLANEKVETMKNIK